jgi:hypothetical protein
MEKRVQASIAALRLVLSASAATADQDKNNFVIFQVFKDGQPLIGETGGLAAAGSKGAQERFLSTGQIKLECNGKDTVSMSMEQRLRGAIFESVVMATELRAKVTVNDYVDQSLPRDGHFPVCIPMRPSPQLSYVREVQVPLENGAASKVRRELGNGYELLVSVIPAR